MLGTIVEWGALGKVVLYSFAATLVLTFVFTTGVLLIESADGSAVSAGRRVLGAVAFVVCAALVVFGIHVMLTTKS